SPAVPMGRLLGWIDEWTQRRSRVKPTGAYKGFDDPAPVQVLALEANRFDADVPWSVPLSAAVRVYFQFLPEENVPAVVKEIRKSFAAFCKADPFFRKYPPQWKDLNAAPLLGHELPADHAWTKTFVSAAGATLGDAPAVTAAPYPCDAFLMQRKYVIPTLLFGPCGAGAHNADEYVIISSVLKTARTLLAATLNWCG
ncbi:MAG: M20/M25/M40 family metallo-hydrolase, partial [Planctomycetaceae bacterium]